MAKQEISFDDYLSVSTLTFEWADSYDTKDWNRLAESLAPQLKVDYTVINGMNWPAISSTDFIKMCSSLAFLGSKHLSTQHIIGASKYSRLSSSEIVGSHQVRAAHVLYDDINKKSVTAKGHGHGVTYFTYQKTEDGLWKIAGIAPTIYWVEHSIREVIEAVAIRIEKGELVE